eukprot:COSAG01_NODE_9502_length_2429_cov_16.362232_2_plen_188_part_00
MLRIHRDAVAAATQATLSNDDRPSALKSAENSSMGQHPATTVAAAAAAASVAALGQLQGTVAAVARADAVLLSGASATPSPSRRGLWLRAVGTVLAAGLFVAALGMRLATFTTVGLAGEAEALFGSTTKGFGALVSGAVCNGTAQHLSFVSGLKQLLLADAAAGDATQRCRLQKGRRCVRRAHARSH